jgi:hypothetical protein
MSGHIPPSRWQPPAQVEAKHRTCAYLRTGPPRRSARAPLKLGTAFLEQKGIHR